MEEPKLFELGNGVKVKDIFGYLLDEPKGTACNVKYDKRQHLAIKAEANRTNASIRMLMKKKPSLIKVKTFGVYKTKFPGYTTVIKEN